MDKKYLRTLNPFLIILTLLFFVFFLEACTSKKQPKPITPEQILTVKSKDLQPGLPALYKDGFWRHIYHMPSKDEFLTGRSSAKPITKIDHRFGDNEIFDSGQTRGVGVQMTGYIHLAHTGSYEFKANSNDGVDIKIAQVQVAYDPSVHSDRFTKPINFSVTKPGWYPIVVRYFQRKGSATLEFHWKLPGESKFTIIPESAYWHIPRLVK